MRTHHKKKKRKKKKKFQKTSYQNPKQFYPHLKQILGTLWASTIGNDSMHWLDRKKTITHKICQLLSPRVSASLNLGHICLPPSRKQYFLNCTLTWFASGSAVTHVDWVRSFHLCPSMFSSIQIISTVCLTWLGKLMHTAWHMVSIHFVVTFYCSSWV
jgi:hypothetical protein